MIFLPSFAILSLDCIVETTVLLLEDAVPFDSRVEIFDYRLRGKMARLAFITFCLAAIVFTLLLGAHLYDLLVNREKKAVLHVIWSAILDAFLVYAAKSYWVALSS